MIKLKDILNEERGPCWKGYQQVGMKEKGGKQVPNCVPESVVKESMGINKMFIAYLGLQKKVRELEDTQKELLQPYLDAKKSNNAEAMAKAIEALKKNQKTLDSFRKNLHKVETKYIQNLDADAELELSEMAPIKEAKKYDIGSGFMGNGLTIWNRAVEKRGEYEIIAHISKQGDLKIYDKELPNDIKKMFQIWADSMKKGNMGPTY